MAGGRGIRLGGIEKPLLKICGKYILEYVLSEASKLSSNVYVAVSPHTSLTLKWCMSHQVSVLITSGKGYSLDIKEVLNIVSKPLLVLPADTPFLKVSTISEFVRAAEKYDKAIVTLVVERTCFPKELRGNVKSPIGIALFKRNGYDWVDIVMCKFPELLDVDTPKDLRYARKLCHEISRR